MIVTIPGFNAGTSLYATEKHYLKHQNINFLKVAILPQQQCDTRCFNQCVDRCRTIHPLSQCTRMCYHQCCSFGPQMW